MYAESDAYFEDSGTNFGLGSEYDERGDQLQLVMLIMTLGLVLSAWASLLGVYSNMRPAFALFGLITFVVALFIYIVQVPSVIL